MSKRKPKVEEEGTEDLDAVVKRSKPTSELMSLRAENDELSATIKGYQKEHGKLEDLIHQVVAVAPRAKAVPVLYRPEGGKGVSSPCDVALHLSDIHYGSVQDPDEIEGFGEYNPEIARARLLNLVRDVLDWADIKRGGYRLPRLHVLMTGDYVSGDIHEELRITNAFPCPVQAVECGKLLSEVLLTLAQHFESVRVHMTTDDNHGRLTQKPQAKQGGLNNWGFVVGSWIKAQVERQRNISVNVIPRSWDSVECNGRRYLLTHGHRVTGWAGFPYYGIERLVAREALKRMNAAEIRKFNRVVMGHWHAPLAHPWYWIGGSVSGTDSFDHGQGRYSEPLQVSWLIHPKHGEFDRTEWRLRV